MRKSLIVVLALLLVTGVCIAPLTNVYALQSTVLTLDYTDFQAVVYGAVSTFNGHYNFTDNEQNMTNPCEFQVSNDLTYNATTDLIQLVFSTNYVGSNLDAAADYPYLKFSWYGNNTFKGYCTNETNDGEAMDISNTVVETPLTINFNGSTITVSDATGWNDTLTTGDYVDFNYLAYKESDKTHAITAGDLTISITSPPLSDIVTEWLPTIISFAMLSMVLGMVTKFAGKKRKG